GGRRTSGQRQTRLPPRCGVFGAADNRAGRFTPTASATNSTNPSSVRSARARGLGAPLSALVFLPRPRAGPRAVHVGGGRLRRGRRGGGHRPVRERCRPCRAQLGSLLRRRGAVVEEVVAGVASACRRRRNA